MYKERWKSMDDGSRIDADRVVALKGKQKSLFKYPLSFNRCGCW